MRQGYRQTKRKRDRETGTQGHRERQRDRKTGDSETGKQGNRETGRHGDMETWRQRDRETWRHRNRNRNIYLLIEIHTCFLKISVTHWHNV